MILGAPQPLTQTPLKGATSAGPSVADFPATLTPGSLGLFLPWKILPTPMLLDLLASVSCPGKAGLLWGLQA